MTLHYVNSQEKAATSGPITVPSPLAKNLMRKLKEIGLKNPEKVVRVAPASKPKDTNAAAAGGNKSGEVCEAPIKCLSLLTFR